MNLTTILDVESYQKMTGFKCAALNASMWINNVVMCEKADRTPWGIKSTPIAAVVIAKRQSTVLYDENGKAKETEVKKSKEYDTHYRNYIDQFKELTEWKHTKSR